MSLFAVILLYTSLAKAHGVETYGAKLQPLLACYEAWCGSEWRKKSENIRYSERPSRSYCRGSVDQVIQNGMEPMILPPESAKSLKFTMFLNGNAYSCDASEVAMPTCRDKYLKFHSCPLEEKWDYITFSIPSSNLGTSKNMNLRMSRRQGPGGEHFEFHRAVGNLDELRKNSEGKTVCQLDNSQKNGQKLQNFLKRLLAQEGSKEAFDLHVQQMRKAAKDARKSETSPTEASPGVSLEIRLARETTFEWARRIATHLTQPYTKKSKPVDNEEIESLKGLYIEQLEKCAQASSLESTALTLKQALEGKKPSTSTPNRSTKAVK